MTVLGVAGCTALLVTAMGARDSVGSVLGDQFDTIYQFDIMASLKEEEMSSALQAALDDESLFTSHLQTMNKNMNATNVDGSYTMTAYLYIPKEPEQLKEFVNLRHRQDKADVPFLEDSVVITEKLADNLGLKVGGYAGGAVGHLVGREEPQFYCDGYLRELCVQLYLCLA